MLDTLRGPTYNIHTHTKMMSIVRFFLLLVVAVAIPEADAWCAKWSVLARRCRHIAKKNICNYSGSRCEKDCIRTYGRIAKRCISRDCGGVCGKCGYACL